MKEFTPLETREKKHPAVACGNLFLTGFTAKVYQVVIKIPVGQVRSYNWVAKKCGSPGAARAVGQVLKRNPYPLIIPCHRVVNSDQKPGGYIFGIKQKLFLLKLEKELKKCILSKK
jgi:methylated-DNA-[protein]-cysteine S-methyltransferase